MRIVRKISTMLLAGALVSTLSGCYFFPEEEQILEPPTLDVADVVYSTYAATKRDIVSQTMISGYLVSKVEAECYFTRYTGPLKNIYVNPGDLVEEGDLIAEMNNGAIEHELEIQRLKVELAQLNYDNSGSAADRLTLEIEQNTLAQYQDEYDGGKIYAPISGQVSTVLQLDPGDMVDPYSVLVRIVDPEQLQVSCTTTSTLEYAVDQTVTIEIGDEVYDGIITRTPREEIEEGDEIVDQLYIDFVGDLPSFAYLGSIANVTRVNSAKTGVIVIPKHVVKTDEDRTFVQVLRGDEKVEVDIEIGISNATQVEVVSGLSEGDLVILK